MDIKIVFHPSGDWEGLYIDEVLKHEGHNTSIYDFVDSWNNTLKENIRDVLWLNYDTRDLGNEEGFDKDFSFPLKYEDIKV